MSHMVCIDAAKTRVVPCDSPEAAFVLAVEDLERFGVVRAPEAKAMPKPADKARRRPATK
jgi:hypothetical protein